MRFSRMIETTEINGEYYAYCEPLAESGYGQTRELAINNLRLKLEDYKASLLERKGRLSATLKSDLTYLERNL